MTDRDLAAFEHWWYVLGSGYHPMPDEDQEEHAHRVARLAWMACARQVIHLDPGRVQRGNGSGGPTTPKPDIVPKPQYPGGCIGLEGAQPLRGRRFQPLPDELDAYCPQDDTHNPPPEEP